jgi:integration host factor subunit beta
MICSGLVQAVAKRKKLEQLRSELVVEAILDCVKAALRRGERIEIRGLGTFSVRRYRGYRGRNPKTGEAVEVAAKRLPHFRPSKTISERINKARPKFLFEESDGSARRDASKIGDPGTVASGYSL